MKFLSGIANPIFTNFCLSVCLSDIFFGDKSIQLVRLKYSTSDAISFSKNRFKVIGPFPLMSTLHSTEGFQIIGQFLKNKYILLYLRWADGTLFFTAKT